MNDHVIHPASLERIRGIHRLSEEYNRRVNAGHAGQLLKLMRKHVDEIEALSRDKNPHYLTETGDLAVLCFELILDGGQPIDDILRKCFLRYENKLTGLLQELKSR